MDVGRPTKYEPRFCAEVIDYMGQGFSMTAFAGNISVARSTINEWMRTNPEFSEAIKIGQAKRTAFLERGLLEGDCGPRITARIFALKNAAPEEWRDRQHHELTGADGGAIRTVDEAALAKLSDAELEQLTAIRTKLADADPASGGEG